ncbi:MAG: hypothetical protein KY393_03590 [Actinobacteria bacterium]|nr:hypothetical protein [Actinomycetota bacterium]
MEAVNFSIREADVTEAIGTWLDVQEAAKKAFQAKKDEIDNPVYEVESAWLSGYGEGWRAAVEALGVDQQEAFNKMAAANAK